VPIKLNKETQKNLTIALDLEGTLISNAVSQFPRPGLFTFLEYCYENFVGVASRLETRLVIFTAVNEVRFRSISRTLYVLINLRLDDNINRSQSRYIHAHRVLESLIQYLLLLRLYPLKLARSAFQSCSVVSRFCH
jgi:hypothetical protein